MVIYNPSWLPYVFPFIFVGGWLGMSWMGAARGGWRRLADRYRGRLEDPDFRVRCSSASLTLHSEDSCGNGLTVAGGEAGVGLTMDWSFAFQHPPLVIPWDSLVECRSWRLLGRFDRFAFAVADTGVRVTLGGAAARRLESELARRDPARPMLAGGPEWW